MDFASALKNLEQTADAASRRGGRGGRNNGGEGGRGRSNNWSESNRSDRFAGGRRGGGVNRDGGGYPPRNYSSNEMSDPHNNNNNRRRGPPSDHYNDHYNNMNHRRHQPRPRLGNEIISSGRGGDYRIDSGRGSRGLGNNHHSNHPSQHKIRPFEEMQRYGYRIDPYRPISDFPSDLGKRPFHIALLAIVIDSMPYEHIWKHWAATTTTGYCQVSLLVHAKFPDRVQSQFLKQRLITKPPKIGRGNSFADPEFLTHVPAWGSIQITLAMIDLLRIAQAIGTNANNPEAEKDPRFSSQRFLINPSNNKSPNNIYPVDKFLFISETCLPVKTLQEFQLAFFGNPELYRNVKAASPTDTSDGQEAAQNSNGQNQITPWEMSWVNARNRNTPGTPKNKYERDQFADIHRMVHGHYRWKADQWLCLSRPHATAVLNVDAHMPVHYQLWNSFKDIYASDEMYFPSVLAVLQILTPPHDGPSHLQPTTSSNGQVALRPVTFTDWSEGTRNPATFSKGLVDLIKIAPLARAQGSLVARKFDLRAPGTNVADGEKTPGAISVEEWISVIQKCQRTEEEQQNATETSLSADLHVKEEAAGNAITDENETNQP